MLTDLKIKNLHRAEKLYRVTDSRGLCIEIHPDGARYWRYRYAFLGRRKMISLGVYPQISLAEARRRRDAASLTLASGEDPSAKRRALRLQAQTHLANTFEAIASEWLSKRAAHLAEPTRAKLAWLISTKANPWIGTRPVNEIGPSELLAVLRRVENSGKLETAHRLKQTCGQVFRYAIATGRSDRDPTGALRGALKTVQTRHHATITAPAKVGELMRAIDAFEGSFVVSSALHLAPLVFVRPGELRKAEWVEIDLNRAEWRIPPAKMKMRKGHVVPLSQQAVEILTSLAALTGSGRFVFPANRGIGRPMSENTVNAALRRIGYSSDEMSGHGFRSMASTLLHELGLRSEVIERQLAHAERNKVKAAYNFAEHLAERKTLMQRWANYLDELKANRESANQSFEEK